MASLQVTETKEDHKWVPFKSLETTIHLAKQLLIPNSMELLEITNSVKLVQEKRVFN